MGLLDDAIREHLELKRKRGGDLSEIERQEHEALAPVRRTDDHAEDPEAAVLPPEPEPEPIAEAPAAEPLPDHLAQPTVEFSVEEHLKETAPDPAPDPDVVIPDDEAEDVLEETPDFLQETPEHDRLWFEQKPPRDFDFDG